jgi:hypothetical protein
VDPGERGRHASSGAGQAYPPAGAPGIRDLPDAPGAGAPYGVGDLGDGGRGARAAHQVRVASRGLAWARVGSRGLAWVKEQGMGDLVYVALIVAFLVSMLGYAVACEKL